MIPSSAQPSPSPQASFPVEDISNQISEETSELYSHDSPVIKVGRKTNMHKREASARKEIELGKQTTLDQISREEMRHMRK